MRDILAAFAIHILFVAPLFAEPFSGLSTFGSPSIPSVSRNQVGLSAAMRPERVNPGSSCRLHLQVVISTGSHIYSLKKQLEESLASQIELESSNLLPMGVWEESPPQMVSDEVFRKIVKAHKGLAEFSREYQIPSTAEPGEILIVGTFTYRLCNNKTCSMPQSLEFQVPLQIVQKEPARK